ncbi:MAG: outer membrane lipoprotein carrier protein LolA [Deltaproteobacteria bacterium]|nr:outer membrane lipoprotein carrier protein LolA [Deltaproteobacteria bacterium]
MQPCRASIFSQACWWLMLIGVLTASVVFAEQPSETPVPCAQWDQRFPQRLTQATAPDALARILAAHTNLGFSTAFTEEKRMTVLRKPLTSSGRMLFIPTRGLYRQVQHPFAQEMLITPRTIQQRQASGQISTLALDLLPGAQAFVGAFLALFSGSWDALLTHFDVYFAQDPTQWHVGLKPNNATMAKMITCLVLDGTETQLGALWMQESNGDVTYDRFLDARLVPEPQWAESQSQFDWAQ